MMEQMDCAMVKIKKIGYGVAVFLCVLGSASCEKDDICVEGNTPLLVIEFFDDEDRETLKNVVTLRVQGEGQESPVNTFTDRSSLNTITLPLKTDVDTTSFSFTSNSAEIDSVTSGNLDFVTFTYNRTEDFKSRACGFIVNYGELVATVAPDADNWIQEIEIIRSTVITSDSTHVKIYH